MINFKCPNCAEEMSVPACLAGKAEACPSCRNRVTVPGEAVDWTQEDEAAYHEAVSKYAMAMLRVGRRKDVSHPVIPEQGEALRKTIVSLLAKKAWAGQLDPVAPDDPKYQERARNSVRRAAQDAQLEAFIAQGFGEDAEYQWVNVNGTDACEDCTDLHGRTMPLREWRRTGRPGYRPTRCGEGCACFLIPVEWRNRKLPFAEPMDRTGFGPRSFIGLIVDEWKDATFDQLRVIDQKLRDSFGDVAEGHLVAAMIDSLGVAGMKSLGTLVSRWRGINDGTQPGLPTAIKSPDYSEVMHFLAKLYLARFEALMQESLQEAAGVAARRTSPKAKAAVWQRAQQKVEKAAQKFTPDIPGMAETVSRLAFYCGQQAAAVAQ